MVPCPSLSTVVQLGKVALFRFPTHELIDIPVTSLSVGRWPTMVPNPALQRGKVAQHWCPTPLNVGNVAQIRCPALSFIFLLPISSPVDKCLTISLYGVCWQVARVLSEASWPQSSRGVLGGALPLTQTPNNSLSRGVKPPILTKSLLTSVVLPASLLRSELY